MNTGRSSRASDRWKLWVIAVLAVVIVVLVILFLALNRSEHPADPLPEDTAATDTAGADDSNPAITRPPATPQEMSAAVLPSTPDAGQIYQDKIIFVGDAMTARMATLGVLTDGVNTRQVWRTRNGTLPLNADITSAKVILPGTGEAMTIAKAVEQTHPAILVITLGTDGGVAYLGETDFKACYSALVLAIRAASPATTVILQSVFPVSADCKVISNDRIDLANAWILAVAAETGCRYLDTQSVLKDNFNNLREAYRQGSDGIQLTSEAYRAVLTYIRTHAAE